MAWKKTPNVAYYKGADWSCFVHMEPNTTPEKAQEFANGRDDIKFFFYVRQPMYLEGLSGIEGGGMFNPGEAWFFNGDPWFGSAPQCDAYEKE